MKPCEWLIFLILVHVEEKIQEKDDKIKELIAGFSDDDETVQLMWKQGDPIVMNITTFIINAKRTIGEYKRDKSTLMITALV